jgi:hypothetical protein
MGFSFGIVVRAKLTWRTGKYKQAATQSGSRFGGNVAAQAAGGGVEPVPPIVNFRLVFKRL